MSDIRSLVLTDIVDSTALTERLGERTAAELWLAHDRIARDLLPAWRGLEIDRTDGFLLLFDKPVDALGYALAYQDALRALPVPVQARAGLHVGAVGLRRNEPADVARGAKPIEVEGLAKPLAARVMAIAQGGQTLLTRAALDALGNIPTPARIRSQGFWRIKGINEPVELFEAAPDAHFLVTTRELLRLPGEQALMLDTMPEPEAIELFERRAHAVNGNPAATAEDQAALGQLMNLLDGLPLAIELAAARTRIMPPRMLLERMRERFRLLTVGSGSRDRQATLRATLDWSWELLGVEEQLALAQLSVFEGSFGLEAAEALIDLAGFAEPPWTTDLVQALVDKSLVRALSDARFDLLLSVRDYASERLRAGGAATEQAARARHCGFYAALAPSRRASNWRSR